MESGKEKLKSMYDISSMMSEIDITIKNIKLAEFEIKIDEYAELPESIAAKRLTEKMQEVILHVLHFLKQKKHFLSVRYGTVTAKNVLFRLTFRLLMK